jgi:hypothetical protein
MPDGAVVEPIADRYEALRRGVLGTALGAESGTGLALFLRRGVWAWARLGAPPGRPTFEPGAVPFAPPLPQAKRSDLARLLAGMALGHPLTQGSPT